MRIFLFFLLFFFVSFIAIGQKIDHLVSYRDMASDHYFRFNYDNDYFAASDRDYTQGYNLELVTRFFKKNPVNFLFYKPKESVYKYGLSIEHIGFTPDEYESPEIQVGDRPFAAAIMLKSFMVATDTARNNRISQSFSLGMIGPAAFGREMQTEIHEATGNKIPLGWRNQIQNDVVINYRVDFEKQLLNYKKYFTLQSNSTLQLGTLFTNASTGINMTAGWLENPFTDNRKGQGFQFYLYAQSRASLIGYDATLQGGLFTNDSPYVISNNQLERVTAQLDYGLVMKAGAVYLEYSRVVSSKEFETGRNAKWGGIKIGYQW
jgi:lipid A 3-O-deacylase